VPRLAVVRGAAAATPPAAGNHAAGRRQCQGAALSRRVEARGAASLAEPPLIPLPFDDESSPAPAAPPRQMGTRSAYLTTRVFPPPTCRPLSAVMACTQASAKRSHGVWKTHWWRMGQQQQAGCIVCIFTRPHIHTSGGQWCTGSHAPSPKLKSSMPAAVEIGCVKGFGAGGAPAGRGGGRRR